MATNKTATNKMATNKTARSARKAPAKVKMSAPLKKGAPRTAPKNAARSKSAKKRNVVVKPVTSVKPAGTVAAVPRARDERPERRAMARPPASPPRPGARMPRIIGMTVDMAIDVLTPLQVVSNIVVGMCSGAVSARRSNGDSRKVKGQCTPEGNTIEVGEMVSFVVSEP